MERRNFLKALTGVLAVVGLVRQRPPPPAYGIAQNARPTQASAFMLVNDKWVEMEPKNAKP